MNTSILGILKLIGLGTGVGLVGYIITEDIKRRSKKYEVKPQKVTASIPPAKSPHIVKPGDLKPWQSALYSRMEEEGMGVLRQELDAFCDAVLTIPEMKEFTEELDDYAVLVGSPFDKMDHNTASVWAGIASILHLRMRTYYEVGEQQRYFAEELHSIVSFLPQLAARVGLQRGAVYTDTMLATQKIASMVCNKRRNYEYEDEEHVAEALVSATT